MRNKREPVPMVAAGLLVNVMPGGAALAAGFVIGTAVAWRLLGQI